MFTYLKKLISGSVPTSRLPVRKRRYQPMIEALEERRLLTTASYADGILTIVGTDGPDTITVRERNEVFSIDGVSMSFGANIVQSIEINGLGGGDTINLDTAGTSGGLTYAPITVPTTIHGGSGSDTIYGGAGPDSIFGDGGFDRLYGRGGDDHLEGGAGTDTLAGGGGSDVYAFVGGTLGSDTISEPVSNGAKDRLDFSAFVGAVKIDLGVTTAQVVRSGQLTLTLSNNTLVEEVLGSAFSDTIKGNSRGNLLVGMSGNDNLLGRGGNDYLRGVHGNDVLDGGAGNDRLYGGNGTDTLLGGSGNDGLFGGEGTDTITGGSGNDRFLSWKNATNSFGFAYDPDTYMDIRSEDAKINFENSTGNYVKDGGEWGFDDDITWNATSWNQNEIERADQGLAELHERTGNTRLLKTSLGFEMTFIRIGSPDKAAGEDLFGSNGSGTIRIFDNAVNGGFDSLVHTVIHEVGHNWDEENPNWQDFLDESSWTQTNMSGVSGYSKAETYGETWYFSSNAEFASDYAMNHPHEDFAESFAAYFVDRAGWNWGQGGGAAAIPGKIQIIDNWLDTM